jgi:hypothetical protein
MPGTTKESFTFIQTPDELKDIDTWVTADRQFKPAIKMHSNNINEDAVFQIEDVIMSTIEGEKCELSFSITFQTNIDVIDRPYPIESDGLAVAVKLNENELQRKEIKPVVGTKIDSLVVLPKEFIIEDGNTISFHVTPGPNNDASYDLLYIVDPKVECK